MYFRIYPDELIHSICARIHFRSGERSFNRTAELLFGNADNTNHIWWPTRLNRLAQSIGVSSTNLINDHTIFPLFRTIVSDEKREILKKILLYGGGNPHTLLGLNKSTPKLHLCPACLQEDISIYGEPYWHRAHQLPGTLVCDKHNIVLISECTICNESFSPNTYQELKLTPLFCSNGHSLLQFTTNSIDDLLLIARENKYLVSSKRLNSTGMREKLTQYMLVCGLLNVNSTVPRYDKLIPLFIKRFPSDVLNIFGVPLVSGKRCWLHAIFRKKYISANPLHYALLMILFGGNIKGFSLENVKYIPFGVGPWPCLNGACQHFKQLVIKSVIIEKSNLFAKPMGVFRCDKCDFTYCRRGPDLNSENLYRYSLIRAPGSVWNDAFEKALQSDVVYIKRIAKQLNVGTVYIKLRIKDRFHEINMTKSRKIDLRKIQRNRLLRLLENNPCLIRNNVEQSLIHWLRMNDTNWLDNTLPPSQKFTLEQRREEYAKLLKEHPEYTKSELKSLNESNYVWLLENDREWMKIQNKLIQSKRSLKIAREERRESLIRLLEVNLSASRTQIMHLDFNNYYWLMGNDREWLEQHLPARKTRAGTKRLVKSLELRRSDFLKVLEENPNAPRKELRQLMSGTYNWLIQYDKEWFREHQPQVRQFPLKLTLEQRREAYVKIREDNPFASRTELKRKDINNYIWLQKNDRDWFEQNKPN